MGSHRPYGTGEEALPSDLDRKAEAAGGRHWFGDSEVTDAEREVILDHYRAALGRVDDRTERLLAELDADNPVFCFTADHGDEFGEDGYYYHQGYRRRVADPVVRVPVVLDGVGADPDRCSLLDVAPTLVESVGLDAPDAWQGRDLAAGRTDHALTAAPWHDRATVAWRDLDRDRTLVARDADVSMVEGGDEVGVESADVSREVEKQLQNLGYRDAG
jgi:arylsulfatase A-like enzyme